MESFHRPDIPADHGSKHAINTWPAGIQRSNMHWRITYWVTLHGIQGWSYFDRPNKWGLPFSIILRKRIGK